MPHPRPLPSLTLVSAILDALPGCGAASAGSWFRRTWCPAQLRTPNCQLAITRSDYRTIPINSGHPVCAALTLPVGADWYWTLAAVPGR
jgi:hypothetical protein